MLAINTFIGERAWAAWHRRAARSPAFPGLAYFGFKFAFLLFLVNGPILFCVFPLHSIARAVARRWARR